jgi:hypothetical protein
MLTITLLKSVNSDMYEFLIKTFYETLFTFPDFKFKEMQGLGLSTEDLDKLIDQMKVRKKRSKFLNVL